MKFVIVLLLFFSCAGCGGAPSEDVAPDAPTPATAPEGEEPVLPENSP